MSVYSISMKKLIRRIIIICLIFEIFLIFTDIFIASNMFILIPVKSFRKIFNITGEHSLANFFSSIQTFCIGITLLCICFFIKAENQKKGIIWFFYGIFFMCIAIDDGIAFHESIGDWISYWINTHDSPVAELMSLYPSYRWHITVGPFLLLAGLFMLYFLWHELKGLKVRRILFVALLCVISAEMLDYLDGMGKPVLLLQDLFHVNSVIIIHLMRIVEEYLEMLSMTLLWYVFLNYLSHSADGKTITFTGE